MAKGLAIIVIMMAVGTAIAVPNWHNFAKNPPPVSTITTTTAASAGGSASSTAGAGGAAQSAQPTSAQPGTTPITILAGAATQGNPNYDPADGKVPLGNKVVWQIKTTLSIQRHLELVLPIQSQVKYLTQNLSLQDQALLHKNLKV